MSHQATHWLAEIAPDWLSASEFRVLFHLCDCHNPALGCFPTQAYLMKWANLSNGGLNKVLRSLEDKGLIRRQRRYDEEQKKALPTAYVLAFDMADPDHTPQSGDRSDHPPLQARPVSTTGATCLHPSGDKPVINRELTGKVTTNQPTDEFSENWRPDAELIAWAQAQGFTSEEIEEQTRRWIIHWRDELKAQPPHPLGKTWRGWMVKEIEFKAKRKAAAPARDDSAKKWRARIDRKYGAAAPGGAA